MQEGRMRRQEADGLSAPPEIRLEFGVLYA
jgi:hypothetical protein